MMESITGYNMHYGKHKVLA